MSDHNQLCEVLDMFVAVMMLLVVCGLAWAMTAWVKMLHAMKAARIEYELAVMASYRQGHVPTVPPRPDDGL